jgi:hypothetical protein
LRREPETALGAIAIDGVRRAGSIGERHISLRT